MPLILQSDESFDIWRDRWRQCEWLWGRIVVRVAGSWIAATGLLMLGWAVRGGLG
jgi:hypothetical protein